MANTYKNAGFSLTTTNKTDVYTCPANTTAIIKTIQTTNYTGSSNIDIVGYVYDSSSTTEFQLVHHTLSSKDSINFIDGVLVLEANDVLRMEVSSANTISGVISILEIDF